MKEVPLTMGKVAIVDDEDYHILIKFKWHYGNGYAIRTVRAHDGSKETVYMHRYIYGSDIDGMEIDHIDCDKLNNRRNNLRLCTRSQNHKNRRKQSNNLSGHKGVYFCLRSRRWVSQIRYDGNRKYLGSFPDKQSARDAYADAAILYHGEFARFE